MKAFFYKLIGIDSGALTEGEEMQLVWTSVPTSWWIMLLLLVLGLVLWFVGRTYQRESGRCPSGVRKLLTVLRCLALLGVVLALLGPALVTVRKEQVVPSVIVLVDRSSSMSVADRYTSDSDIAQLSKVTGISETELRSQPPERLEVVQRVLAQNDGAVLKQLAERGRVKLYGFSSDAEVAMVKSAGESIETSYDWSPDGTTTNLSQAIRKAIAEETSNPISAVVVLSDGQHNEGLNPVAVARYTKTQNIPLYTVGVGSPKEPFNLKVSRIWAPSNVFKGDPFLLESQLNSSGGKSGPRKVELVQVDDSGRKKVLDSQMVNLGGDDNEARVRFDFKPEEAGVLKFVVRVAVDQGEIVTSDNARQVQVKVTSDRARVLLIAGSPSWEYRMVSQMLIRDETIDVSCWLQSMETSMRQDGNTVIHQFPETAKDLLVYDVIVMLDPNPDDFSPTWLALLDRFVSEHAGGLFYQAGAKYTPKLASLKQSAGLLDILPVELPVLSRLEMHKVRSVHNTGFPLQLTAHGVDHQMMRLSAKPEHNRKVWQLMPPLYWSFPVSVAKPATQTLVVHPHQEGEDARSRALLTAGQFGAGRTVFMGFDGSWTWRRKGEKFFDQFWVQSVRYLIEGRLLAGQRRVQVEVGGETFELGENIEVTAKVFDEQYKPISANTIQAKLIGKEGEKAFTLNVVAGRKGEFRGNLVASFIGANRIVVTSPQPVKGETEEGVVGISVILPQSEFADIRMNQTLLDTMARDSGGSFTTISTIEDIVGQIPDRRETLVFRGKPKSIWDSWLTITVIVLLLGLEWFLRKRFQLI